MYSVEERQKAVDLFLASKSESVVWQTLGYPSPNALRAWVREYLEFGELHEKVRFKPRYFKEQINAAVTYYVEHQCGLAEACRELGYPNRMTLRDWILDSCPEKLHKPAKQYCKHHQKLIRYSTADKIAIVNEHIDSRVPLYQLAAKYHVSKAAISKWKKQLVGGGISLQMKEEDKVISNENKVDENEEISSLKAQIHQLRMERDALLIAAEIIKKDKGISLENLRNAEKTDVINALRNVYQLSELLELLKIAKSSYFYCIKCRAVDKHKDIRVLVVRCFSENNSRYGYRRISDCIRKTGLIVSEKVVRRIMREEGLIVSQPPRQKYNSYQGEISPAADNIIRRNFHADRPNQKWLTDITEFAIPAGKVYLSIYLRSLTALMEWQYHGPSAHRRMQILQIPCWTRPS